MAKKIQLEDLVNKTMMAQTIKPAQPKIGQTMYSSEPSIPSQKIKLTNVSTDDIASALASKQPAQEKTVVEPKETAIIDNAFKSMGTTLEDKMNRTNEALKKMEENAKEMALDNELEDLEVESDETTEEPAKEVEEDEIDVDSIIINNAQSKPAINTVEQPKVEVVTEEPAETEEEKEEDAEVKEEIKAESSSINDFMKDIDVDLDEADDYKDEKISLADSEAESNKEETEEETKARLRSGLRAIKSESDNDFSGFTIATKPISGTAAIMQAAQSKELNVIDFPLYETKRNIRMSEVMGPELQALNNSMANGNKVNAAISALRMLYNHTVDANKPSFEEWCKIIKAGDSESLYFALYKACYGGANVMAVTCSNEKCGKTSIVEIPIDDMIKYKDDAVKKECEELKAMDTTTEKIEVKSKLIAISKDFAVACSMPSLYDTIIQFSGLKQKLIDKYEDLLNTMAYITAFYKIDSVNKTLIPIEMPTFKNNINKTILAKLKIYAGILKTLTVDEYEILTGAISELGAEDKVTYVVPEITCPVCGEKIAEEPIMSMLDMLFLRRQLARLRNI